MWQRFLRNDSCLFLSWLENDDVAETFKSSHQTFLKRLCVGSFEVVGAEVLIGLLAMYQVVGNREYGKKGERYVKPKFYMLARGSVCLCFH